MGGDKRARRAPAAKRRALGMRRTFVLTFLGLFACICLSREARAAAPKPCSGEFRDSATWLSIAHPGLGEYFLRGWGPFFERAPQKKFWLGFIPVFGWPGYLQAKSIYDVRKCRTHDDLWNWD
jgi:hypothetical protein